MIINDINKRQPSFTLAPAKKGIWEIRAGSVDTTA